MAKHQARNFRFKFLLAMLIGILIGGLCSFAYYHFEIVPRKQQEVEKYVKSMRRNLLFNGRKRSVTKMPPKR
ncbi:hypothetical protein LCACRF28_2769 [Lacticaseibacillus paracasei]|nr:hypothetical protein LCACRF28_2769 [Lacticaseibacillus paracasei]